MSANAPKAAGLPLNKEGQPLKGSRIIIWLEPLEPGVNERQALAFGHHLAQGRHAQVEIWCGQESQSIRARCEELALPFRLVATPLPWSMSRVKRVVRLLKFAWTLRRARPDVLLPYGFLPSVVCGVVWRLTGARSCVWNQDGDTSARMIGRPEKTAVRHTPAFIANSEDGVEFLISKLGVHREQVSLVHIGIELDAPEKDRATWRQEIGVSQDCLLAYIETNAARPQDYPTLFEAWSIVVERLQRENREAVLVVASRFAEDHRAAKAVAFDLELYDSVRFLGQVKDLAGLANAVELCMHAPLVKGCPSSVLESMGVGLPVTGSDTVGMREAVGPAGYSLLAAPKNAEALAGGILDLALNKELRTERSIGNRQRIETEFNTSLMCEQTLEVIAHTIEPSRG